MISVALAHLEERREEINDLNVFPVADGDTGDNMALTLRAVLAELDRLEAEAGDRTVDEMAHAWMNVVYLSDDEYTDYVAKQKKQQTQEQQQ